MKKLRVVLALFLGLGIVIGLSACGAKDPTDLSDKEFEAIVSHAIVALDKELEASINKESDVRSELTESRVYYDDVREKYFVRLTVTVFNSADYYMKQIEGDEYKQVFDDAEIEAMKPIYIVNGHDKM